MLNTYAWTAKCGSVVPSHKIYMPWALVVVVLLQLPGRLRLGVTATGGRGQPICCADLQVLQAGAWNAQREA